MTTDDARQENVRVGAAARDAAEAMTEPGWVTAAPATVTRRRVVLDLVSGHASALAGTSALYARPDDDAPEGAITLPLIYLTPEDFRALGEREQITITIEPGDQLNPGHRAPCVDDNVCGDPNHCPPSATPPVTAEADRG